VGNFPDPKVKNFCPGPITPLKILDTINLEDPPNANLKNAIKEIIANNTNSRGTEAQVFYV